MAKLNYLLSVSVMATFVATSSGVAHADAPPPYGFWTSPGNEQLLVNLDNSCSFGVNGQPNTIGPCTWQPSAIGGILAIKDTLLYKPAPIYFNVVYVDDDDITIQGDPFHRIG